MTEQFKVNTTTLNLRSAPVKDPSNLITPLLEDHIVSKISVAEDESWWKILTIVNGQAIEGFVAHRFLSPAPKRIQAIGWFKEQFRSKIKAAIIGSPFSLDMLTAIALQETYYIWGNLYGKLPIDEVLKLCVGDTLDSPNRSAFPKNKLALVDVANGDAMFDIARKSLENVGAYIPEYKNVADSSPNKFCHGFGIFQLDLQFFKENPDYFLQTKWHSFDECLNQCIRELRAALKRAYGNGKDALTDDEKVYVAIAYNRGSVDFSRKFKQGFKDDSGTYYGEYVEKYLKLSKSVP